MRKIIRLIFVALLFVGASQNNAASLMGLQDASKRPRPIEVFSIPEFPAMVSEAVLGKGSSGSEVSYTVTNLTNETVNRILLLAMVFDKDGAFLRTENVSLSGEMFPSAAEQVEYSYLQEEVKPEERVVITTYQVIGQDGIWEVDAAKLEEAVKAFVSGQAYEALKVRYDKNLVLTDEDKSELYRKTLEGLLLDKGKTTYLTIKDAQNVILSTADIEPQLIPKISGVNIKLMTPKEIKAKIKRDGTFGYLYFYPFSVEGRRAYVSIMYYHYIKVREDMYQPCCGSFDTIFRRENGKWLEESSVGARI